VLGAWTSCANASDPTTANDQCTTLTVPVDYAYAKSDGPKVTLAVVRRPATDQAHRIGLLAFVYGGPGAPVLGRGPLSVTDAVAQNFDRVGFDPRGVGTSTAPKCYTDALKAEMKAVDQAPLDAAGAAAWGGLIHDVEQGCLANGDANTQLITHMNTHDHVFDIEALRAALEAEDRSVHGTDGMKMQDYRINLYGSSYGTEIVANYMTLFPTRVRSAVLDSPSAVDLTSWTDYQYEQLQAYEIGLQRFFAWCSNPSNGCDFGVGRPTRQAVQAAWDALDQALDQAKQAGHPVVFTSPNLTLTFDSAKLAVTAASEPGLDAANFKIDYHSWKAWAAAIRKLELSLPGSTGGDNGQDLAQNFFYIGALNPDDENGSISYPSYKANDKPMVHHDGTPYTMAEYFDMIANPVREVTPRMWQQGDFDMVGVDWPTRSPYQPVTIDAHRAPPALLISSAYEWPCPTGWADRVKRLLNNGSYLLRHDADGHILGPKMACTRAAMEKYYVSLTPPQDGECTGLSPEIPWDLDVVPPFQLAEDQDL
jgi:pimeloyl-ACP methyl ester carboxylesterase